MLRHSLDSKLSSNVYFCIEPTWNTDLLKNVGENFVMKEFPADKKFTIWWINLNQQDPLIHKKQKLKRRVLTEKMLDEIARLERTRRKSLKRLAQRLECQRLVKEGQHNCGSLDPIKLQQSSTHALQPHDPAIRVHVCSSFYSLSPKVRSIRNWHYFLMKRGFTSRNT
jgi:hypothetical protein